MTDISYPLLYPPSGWPFSKSVTTGSFQQFKHAKVFTVPTWRILIILVTVPTVLSKDASDMLKAIQNIWKRAKFPETSMPKPIPVQWSNCWKKDLLAAGMAGVERAEIQKVTGLKSHLSHKLTIWPWTKHSFAVRVTHLSYRDVIKVPAIVCEVF